MKIILLLLLATSCSFKKNPLSNQTPKGHEELYSEPERPKLDESSKIKRIVIAATNDLQGHLSAHEINFKDDFKGQHQIRIGGKQALSTYLRILRQTYGDVLLVDSGNLFSANPDLKAIQSYYNENQYDAVTVGLGDFNLKLPSGISSNAHLIREFAKDSKTPLVLSNLFDLKTSRTVEWPGIVPYQLKEINGIKVGIIGLVADDIASLTPVNNRVGLFIENMLQSTLRQARLLRSLGADLIVVITHQGIDCGETIAQESKLPLNKVNFEPRKKVCDLNSALGTYLERLPPYLVDVVIGGRNNKKAVNYINETLVLSGFEKGMSISYAEFYIDTEAKKVLRDKTIPHQPIMTCHEFFKSTRDCYYEDSSVNHEERIPATFLGEKIEIVNPMVSQVRTTKIQVQRALAELNGDIAFYPESSRETQLVSVNVTGYQLIKLLEQDYNRDEGSTWHPSPFRIENGLLHLSVQGEDITPTKNYKVLMDLESLQKFSSLRKNLHDPETAIHMEFAWNSFSFEDAISSIMSAQSR